MEGVTPKEALVIAHKATGKSARQTAIDTNIPRTTVRRLCAKHKDIIADEQAKIVEKCLSNIVDRTVKEIEFAKNMPVNTDKETQLFLSRVDKKEDNILKGVGISPSHAPSIHIQNIYNDNRKEVISPIIADMLQGKISELTEPIDAEFEEVG
jgi:hypothetical protein